MDRKYKILIIDDEEDLRENLKYILEKQGYDVFVSMDGQEGLQTAKAEKPDLIILDILMPGLNGTEVIKKLKLEPLLRDIPVFFLTGLVSRADEALGLSGINVEDHQYRVIAKPFEQEKLLKTIKSVLSSTKNK